MNDLQKEAVKRIFFRFILLCPIIFTFTNLYLHSAKNSLIIVENLHIVIDLYPLQKYLVEYLGLNNQEYFDNLCEIISLGVLGLCFMTIISRHMHLLFGLIVIIFFTMEEFINELYLKNLFQGIITREINTKNIFSYLYDQVFIYFGIVSGTLYCLIKS